MLENLKIHNPGSGGGDVLWPSLISYHTVNHLGCQPLPKLKKVTAMALPLEIENCNENQTKLNRGQYSSSMATMFSDVQFTLTLHGINLTSRGLLK